MSYLFRLSFRCVCTLFLLWSQKSLYAQVDTTYQMELFGKYDFAWDSIGNEKKVSVASRRAENGDEVPVRTFVINKEEIRRNGWITLVDVLKTLPGFRTSQPGSALMGETFLMRGLIGNTYTKILVNGIPIQPSGAQAMPLGAQLPIQSAERIEIVLGPASANFGADAMAGVINIVLSEVDRPIEAYGAVALGSDEREYIQLNLGGKLGKNRNVLNYSINGSFFGKKDQNLNWDPGAGIVAEEVLYNQFWNPASREDSLTPRVEDLPHESKNVGVYLNFKALSYSYQYLSREDHSALGSHPMDVAYYDESTFTGEKIQAHQLKWRQSFGKLQSTTNLSALHYKMDPSSSYLGIAHPISAGKNFQHAKSLDFQFEQLIQYEFSETFTVLGGVNLERESGDVYQGYLLNPFDREKLIVGRNEGFIVQNSTMDSLTNVDFFSPFNTYKGYYMGFFTQAYFTTEKWKVIAAARYDTKPGEYVNFSPKLGFYYNASPKFRFRGMYGRSFRAPNVFYRFNNYKGLLSPVDSMIHLQRNKVSLRPEILTNFEGGIDFLPDKNWKFSLHTFYHLKKNSLVTQQRFPKPNSNEQNGSGGGGPQPPDSLPPLGPNDYSVEYYSSDSLSTLLGIQLFVTFDDHKFLKIEAGAQFNKGLQGVNADTQTKPGYNDVPDAMGTLNLHLKLPAKFYLSVYSKVFSDYDWGAQVVNDSLYLNDSKGYYNLDLVASKDLSKRLTFFARVNNITGTVTKGLYSNTLSGYQFPFIPQSSRSILMGFNFDLNRKEGR